MFWEKWMFLKDSKDYQKSMERTLLSTRITSGGITDFGAGSGISIMTEAKTRSWLILEKFKMQRLFFDESCLNWKMSEVDDLMTEDYSSTIIIESYSNLEPEQWVQYANNMEEEGAKRALLKMENFIESTKTQNGIIENFREMQLSYFSKDTSNFRNVCTFWRTIMDAERITVDTASIQLEKESVEICLNNYKKKFTGVDFIKRAHRDWTTVLASLRLVRRFSVQINDTNFQVVSSILQNSSRSINRLSRIPVPVLSEKTVFRSSKKCNFPNFPYKLDRNLDKLGVRTHQELHKVQFSELPVQIVGRVLDKLGI
ncbi:unnamed protein product [Caenorhabditis nigoni]